MPGVPAPTPMSATWGAQCPTCGAKHEVPKLGDAAPAPAAPDKASKPKAMPSAEVKPIGSKPPEEKKETKPKASDEK